MHVLMTDAITCPRCGPEYGLVLLAERTEKRRVLEGSLGCMNCRESYSVRGGYADLRFGAAEADTRRPEINPALLAALLGIEEGPALVAIIGSGAVYAQDVSTLIPDIEIAAVSASLADHEERAGVSRIGASRNSLPFRDACMKAVALTDPPTDALVQEAARVATVRARVVAFTAGADVLELFARHGLRTIAHDERAVVGERVLF